MEWIGRQTMRSTLPGWMACHLSALPQLAFIAIACLSGCTSNRFQLANDPRINRNAELAEIDSRIRQVPRMPPVGPGPAAPLLIEQPLLADRGGLAPTDIGAGALPPTRVQPDDRDMLPSAENVPSIPAATYPPAVTSPPAGVADPDESFASTPTNGGGVLGGPLGTTQTPRPGPTGTIQSAAVGAGEIAGRVLNSFNRPEPNASIQVYDLQSGRTLAAELASGPDGRFRVSRLQTGVQYELVAGASLRGLRSVGSTAATVPEGAALIRLEPENKFQSAGSNGSSPSLFGSDGWWSKVAPQTAAAEPALAGQAKVSAPRVIASQASNPTTAQTSVGESSATPTASTRTAPNVLENAAASDRVAQPRSGTLSAVMQSAIITKDGGEARLEALAGDLILLDFFGSWCAPCRKSAPHLNELHSKYAARGLHVVGVACEYGNREQRLANLRTTSSNLGMYYTTVLAVAGFGEPCPLRASFDVTSFPTFVLLDRSGRILYRGSGADAESFNRLDAAIASQLAALRK